MNLNFKLSLRGDFNKFDLISSNMNFIYIFFKVETSLLIREQLKPYGRFQIIKSLSVIIIDSRKYGPLFY